MNKFDSKVVDRAVDYAKNNFLDYVKKVEQKTPYTIPLDRFKNPHYAQSERLAV